MKTADGTDHAEHMLRTHREPCTGDGNRSALTGLQITSKCALPSPIGFDSSAVDSVVSLIGESELRPRTRGPCDLNTLAFPLCIIFQNIFLLIIQVQIYFVIRNISNYLHEFLLINFYKYFHKYEEKIQKSAPDVCNRLFP